MWPQGLRTTFFRQRPHTRRPMSIAPGTRPAPSGAAEPSSGLHGVRTLRRAPPAAYLAPSACTIQARPPRSSALAPRAARRRWRPRPGRRPRARRGSRPRWARRPRPRAAAGRAAAAPHRRCPPSRPAKPAELFGGELRALRGKCMSNNYPFVATDKAANAAACRHLHSVRCISAQSVRTLCAHRATAATAIQPTKHLPRQATTSPAAASTQAEPSRRNVGPPDNVGLPVERAPWRAPSAAAPAAAAGSSGPGPAGRRPGTSRPARRIPPSSRAWLPAPGTELTRVPVCTHRGAEQ